MKGKWWQWLIIAVFSLTVLMLAAGMYVTLKGCAPKPAPTYRYRGM